MMGLMMLVSCNKDKDNNDGKVVFHATIVSRTQDRTYLDPVDTVGYIKWSAGDKIKIYNGNDESAVFTLESGANTTNGTFVFAGEFELVPPYVAVYPYTTEVELYAEHVYYNVPAVQNITQPGTFAQNTNPMVAYSEDENLQFSNLCGGLGIQLYGSGAHVSRITIKDPWHSINGEFPANFVELDSCQYGLESGPEDTEMVTLTCDVMLPASADEAVAFYAVLPPGALAPGAAIKIYDGDYQIGEIYVIEQSTAQVERNKIKYFAPLEITMLDIYEEVDLGLPSGLRWATCNIGANTPEEYGDYIAWAEAFPKDEYTEYNYSFPNYNPTVLEPENDAATIRWSYGWRMPTKEEWQELYNNTTVTWTQQNGVNGRLFTATNGNSLFLPAAGFRSDSSLLDAGGIGVYWSSSLCTGSPYNAWYFYFNSNDYFMNYDIRYDGQSVRPVRLAH